ncbi:MAG: protein kinase [Desulfobacterales bacterium]|jgi:serine/threonine protein kinase
MPLPSSTAHQTCYLEENAGLGLIHDGPAIDPLMSPSIDIPYNLVDVQNLTPTGARILHHRVVERGTALGFMAFDRVEREWRRFRAKVIGCRQLPDQGDCHTCDLELTPAAKGASSESPREATDLEFLMNTPLFASIPQRALLYLINCLRRRHFRPGERLFDQGTSGDCLYIIQSGVSLFMVEKDGRTHRVSRFQTGDVCGAMSVLTGEPRRGHAEAESDILAWRLDRRDFDRVAAKHHELRVFLTDLVTQRLESWSYTGDRTVGKYTIKYRIGTGGWGIVYHGYHMALGMPVAIKMLKHDMAMDPLFLETFRQEAKTIARLNHHNIVQIFDIDEVYQTIFIIMEYLEGESLRSVLKQRGTLTVPEAINYLSQILHGLVYAHKRGIVHRDIKPENIFLLRDGRIKILDFGLAAAPGEEDLSLHAAIYYAPPEQIEGEPEDTRSDIYALGIMAFELLYGKRPFPENDLSRLMDLHCQQEIPDPAGHIPDLPKELCRFITKCCRIDPAQRYASSQEALDDLDHLARKLRIKQVAEKHLLTSVYMIYPERRRQGLARLLEKFSREADRLGIVMKTNEPMDI